MSQRLLNRLLPFRNLISKDTSKDIDFATLKKSVFFFLRWELNLGQLFSFYLFSNENRINSTYREMIFDTIPKTFAMFSYAMQNYGTKSITTFLLNKCCPAIFLYKSSTPTVRNIAVGKEKRADDSMSHSCCRVNLSDKMRFALLMNPRCGIKCIGVVGFVYNTLKARQQLLH